ncbi:MAG: dTDP-4-amino-4,6-dideoxygalactose transaminase [Myxococcota bacterium]
MTERIPFNKPFIVGKELFYISQAVLEGQLAGNGAFTRRCEAWLERTTGAARVLLTTSCTAALEMAAMLCDVEEGDEVILPSFTFVSTANAFALRGARLRFVDIRPDTLNLDEEQLEAAIGPRTRGIVPVHYAGVGCAMDRILEIADHHDLWVVEDAAQAVNSNYRGRPLGTFGQLGCFSFHETKNFICGEGGALVVNDPAWIERAEILREKGTNRSQFLRGDVDKYSWVDVGSSYVPSELNAAFLYAQLEEAAEITHKRAAIFSRYRVGLAPLEEAGLATLPTVPVDTTCNGHMFYLIAESAVDRNRILHGLEKEGIQAVFHYVPLHSSPMGRAMGYAPDDLPVTEELAARLIRLPCYFELSADEQDRVIEAVLDLVEP